MTRQPQDFAAAAEELYLHRNEIGDEGRALLALALHRLEIMPKEQEQLLREIDAPIKARAFDPLTFTSTTRAEAICTFAFATIAPKIWTPEKQKRVRDRLNALMSSSASLSTQENLWLLLAFKSMLGTEGSDSSQNLRCQRAGFKEWPIRGMVELFASGCFAHREFESAKSQLFDAGEIRHRITCKPIGSIEGFESNEWSTI